MAELEQAVLDAAVKYDIAYHEWWNSDKNEPFGVKVMARNEASDKLLETVHTLRLARIAASHPKE